MRAPRKLTVLASLDVAGYTRLVERDERGTLLDLAKIRLQIIKPTLQTYGGNLFKTMGDGALIEFPSVEDSVRWAIAFQTAMAKRNEGKSEEDAINVRLGVALADVFVAGEDRFGAAVGFVVRLQQVAPPGGIAITHSVRWQLVKSLAAEFDRTEWVEFKNIEGEFEIWLWRGVDGVPAQPADAALLDGGYRPSSAAKQSRRLTEVAAASPAVAEGGRPSIAVLPFDNMSGDPAADSIVDGVVEEITATLSRIRDFRVTARNSAYAYKGKPADVRDISRELGVRYVLEGSLRKAGGRVRVTAQLIDAGSGTHLWADSYDGVVDNLFDFEDQIARQVAGAVNPSIRAAEIEFAKRKRPDNLLAYDLVMRALPHLWAHRRTDNAEAIRLLDEARKLDPGYARATAVAAWARAQHVVYNWATDIDAIRAEGRELIEKAAADVGDDTTALTALATATTLLLGDLDRAGHFADQALALDPNNAWAWTRRGFILAYSGNADGAITAFEHAFRLSPLDPFSFNGHIGMGFAHFVQERHDLAIEWALRGMRQRAGMTWAYRDLAVYYALAGRADAAREAVATLIETRPELTVAKVGEALSFIAAPVLARYLEGLKLAGLQP